MWPCHCFLSLLNVLRYVKRGKNKNKTKSLEKTAVLLFGSPSYSRKTHTHTHTSPFTSKTLHFIALTREAEAILALTAEVHPAFLLFSSLLRLKRPVRAENTLFTRLLFPPHPNPNVVNHQSVELAFFFTFLRS